MSSVVGLPCCCCCSLELAAGVDSVLVAIEPAATAGPTKQGANGLLWRLLLSAPRAAVAAVAANRNTTIGSASRASAVIMCGLC